MKKRSSFEMEINSSIDLSLLRRPLTPFTGFSEAKSAFEKGTAEVRHLLLHECSLIYECNICRNMFRSLANFISHKRVFCCKSALEKHDSHDTTSFTETRRSSVAHEYLPTKFSSGLHQKNTPVPVSDDDAVTVVAAKKSRLSNAELNQAESQTTRGDLGLGSSKNNYAADLNETSNQRKNEQNADQSNTSYVFQCPTCTLTFLKSSSVIRHLASAHNIPMRRIRMLRDTITKRPAETVLINGDETQPKTKSKRELKSLQTAKAESNATATATTVEAAENSNDEELTKCIFCEKSFERRAMLAAHLQTCHIKLEMLEGTKSTTTSTKSPTPSAKRMRLQSNASSVTSNKNQTTTQAAAIAADVDCALHAENEDVKRTFAHLEQQDFGGGLQTVSLDKLDISAGESTNASIEGKNEVNSTTAEKVEDVATEVAASTVDNIDTAAVATSPTPSNKKRKIRTNCVMKQCCRCKICGKQFNALSNLRRHISMFHYRSRKFGCALCDYCAFRRYDIENHLSFVHKMSSENGNETAKLVRVNDVHYTKDDMDEDIVLLSNVAAAAAADDEHDEQQASSLCLPTTNEANEAGKPTEKRRRRRNKNLVSSLEKQLVGEAKTTAVAVDSTVEIKLTRQTLKRSLSANVTENVHTTTRANQKRPTRNRVKPVNKDFVYDLNDLKKEQTQAATAAPATVESHETYQLRGSKRRNTLNAMQAEPKPITVPAFDYIKPKHHVTIKGAARRSCLLLVNLGLAASSTLPEIPSERPQMRARLVSLQRSDSQAAPIIDSTELDAARLKSLPLCDDSYLEKIAKESVGSFQMKPCLAQQHSALDTLLQKVDFTKQMFTNGAAAIARQQMSNEINEVAVGQASCLDTTAVATGFEHCTNTAIAAATSPCYITPEQAIPKAFVTPTKPQKRLPSLDRLTETLNSALGDSYYNATPLEQ